MELPSSMHVLYTFIFGAAFKVFGFLSFVDPETWWEKATHWDTGTLRAFGNFSIQVSASASDLGLSPLNTTITPWASFWIPGHTLSFLMLPESKEPYLIHPKTLLRLNDYRLMFHAQRYELCWLACKVLLKHWIFEKGS